MIRKLKEYLKENYLRIMPIMLSIIAIVVSIVANVQSSVLKEKSDRLNSYGMDLNYQLDFLDEIERNNVSLVNGQIQIEEEAHITILPKVGGIQKVYLIFYYEGNVYALLSVDMFEKNIVDQLDAQNACYYVGGYNLDIVAEDENNYYSTLFIVIEDFKHNFYSNMIIYTIDKADISNMDIKVYSEIDLLNIYNQDLITIPEFDSEQLEEYLSLKDKLDKIL